MLLQNGRKETDKLVETGLTKFGLEMKIYISNINWYLLYQILLRRFLFYYPFMHLWQKHDYAWWRGDRGDRGKGIFRDFIWTTETRDPRIYIWGWGGYGRPGCLVIFPRICQIIILMNYKAVIATKAASTEWFPTLSKWSLWRSREELLIAGIQNSLSMILQILKHSRLNTQKLFSSPTQLWLLKDWNMKTLSANLMAYNNVCDSLKMNIYQAKSFLLCPEMGRDTCSLQDHRWEIMISKNIINNNIVGRW